MYALALALLVTAAPADPPPLPPPLPPAPSAPVAAPPSGLAHAIAAFERGEYPITRDELTALLGSGALKGEQEAQALTYDAAAQHALGESAQAFDLLVRLWKNHPDTKIDPLLFLPDFVALSRKASEQVSTERRLAQAPPPSAKPVASAPAEAVRAPASQVRPLRIAAYGALGVGAAAALAGGIVGLVARSERGQVERALSESPVTSLKQADAFALSRAADANSRLANGLFITAGAAAVTGAGLYLASGPLALTAAPGAVAVTGALP